LRSVRWQTYRTTNTNDLGPRVAKWLASSLLKHSNPQTTR
jgi:hypothetical protein